MNPRLSHLLASSFSAAEEAAASMKATAAEEQASTDVPAEVEGSEGPGGEEVAGAAGHGGGSGATKKGGDPMSVMLASLQKDEKGLGQQFDVGYKKFESAWAQADALLRKKEKIWQERSSHLEELCMKLRDAVDKVYESKEICEEAQSDDWQGLPSLFRKKAQDPDRFAKYGAIKGCVDEEGNSKDCVCETGDEATGCSLAEDYAGHKLACTQIFKTRAQELNLSDVFKAGGPCQIGREDSVNKPIVSVGEFSVPPQGLKIGHSDEDVAQACVPLVTIAASPPSWLKLQARRRESCRQDRLLTGRAKLQRDALLFL